MGPGSLVTQVYNGGIKNRKPVENTLGLVIKELKRGFDHQLQVEWIQGKSMGKKLWYYKHELAEAE